MEIFDEEDEEIKELMRRISEKEITLCDSCDTFFDYIPNKLTCDGCNKKKRLEWRREYNRRPEVIAKERERARLPEERERKREYDRKRRKRPEERERLREYKREYRKRPEVVEKRRKYQREYYQRPEQRERRRKQQRERRQRLKKLREEE